MNIKEFYNQIPVGLCIIRRNRKNMDILYANHALAQIMSSGAQWQGKGMKLHPADIIGKELKDIWSNREIDELINKLKSPVPPKDYSLPFQSDTQSQKRWMKLNIQETEFQGEDVFILWMTDISANKKAEDKLLQAVEQADAAAEMKANFLATMSHEIRTPMQSVYGLLELIGEEKPEEQIASMVHTAKNSASGLLEILDDILDYAKMDAEKMELDHFEVPVRTLIYGIIEALSVKIHGQHVQLLNDIDKSVPFVVIGDPKRLRQVIMNLAGNALKFTKDGSVTIRVTDQLEHIVPPQGRIGLRFEIIDTGIGMSEEALSRMFKPFSQADSSTSRKYGGTGLGLSICKALVELMGGKIGVNSIEGKGSTFWFEIPTEEISTDSQNVNLPDLDGVTIISVEDHPQGAKEIVRSLESMGAIVESCQTYKDGLALMKRKPFDIAIIDQGLPDGLGLDLIREIMPTCPQTGFLMYTVRDDLGLQHSLNSLGVKYLTKPASRLGLGEAVKDAACKRSAMSITGPTRLLIAEDTESVRDVLKRQLDKLGMEADFVENGMQALGALESGKYGILFTDLHMPEMDGYELVKTIREKEEKEESKSFPIVVLTADVQMGQRQTYLSYGFDECLLKPVSLGHFKRLLIRWGLFNEEETPENTKTNQNEEALNIGRLDENQDKPAVDTKCIESQMGALDENAITMMHMFSEMTEPLIERLEQALEHEDFSDIKEAAHSLKGAARSACCPCLGDYAAELQDIALINPEKCAELIKNITAEFARVQDAIQALKIN